MKTYIGIDFSINSPALTLYLNDEFHFFSFFNFDPNRFLDKKFPKAITVHRMLHDSNTATLIPYLRKKTAEDYSEDQFNKIKDADNLATLITKTLISNVPKPDNLDIAIEGYSYGSKGNAIIDIVSFNSVLRNYLYRIFPAAKIWIFSPSAIKKFAGKGNAKKSDMLDYFLAEPPKHKFSQFVAENKEMLVNSTDVKKPVDDIIDSYFICKYLMHRVIHDALR